ncbi:MAG: ribosomal RNA small subunit methyltransferase A [Candidatus Dormibacteraeota bacterium]|uniref:Ribosomal RNA small subunit methyltransferase A n=1 Tax=Candidatus Amunia macphersoniae TaxID=3127014 RepID=A0A934KNK1_9BACT|nr:ribosomal RNA small subunit methyltransferase A [Candidatus Dormibacteraeota bacterium]
MSNTPAGAGVGDLTDPRTLQAVARRVGLVARHRLGQNFLVDRQVLDDIIAALAPSVGEDVLEVGSGVGTLTGELAVRARRVFAVDIDERCVAATRITQRDRVNVEVTRGDALRIDVGGLGLGDGWVAAGNIPYSITTPLLTRLFELPSPPARGVFLVQREVAARLAAGAGDWSLATVAVRSLATVERLRDVSPASFEPPPAVHSSVIRLRPDSVLSPDDRAAVLDIARRAFQMRRKMLRHGIANAAGGDDHQAMAWLDAAGIDPGRRPGTLDIGEWQRIAAAARTLAGEP